MSVALSAPPGALPPAEPPSLMDIARSAVCDNLEDMEAAIAAGLTALDSRPDLDAECRRLAMAQMVYRARSALRYAPAAPEPVPAAQAFSIGNSANIRRLAERDTLYDWPLPNSNLTLGNATAADLEAAAVFHIERAQGDTARALMYRRIKAGLGKSTGSVRAVLSEAKLARLMEAPR